MSPSRDVEGPEERPRPTPEAEDGHGGDERPKRKKRRPGARRRLLLRIVRRSSVSIALVVILGVAVASQTREGQELVLRAALDRVRGALAGDLVVGGIRSGTLLTGATLTNVRMDAADGRRFLRADSVVVRYSIASLLTGGSPIRTTTIHGADIEISRYPDEDALNVSRLLADRKRGADSGTPAAVDLGRIGIRRGTLRLLTPAEPGDAGAVPGPDGRPLRRIRFEGLDLDVERALVRPGSAVSFEAGLASFSASILVFDEPRVVREVFGRVTFGDQGLRVQDGAFRLPSTLLRGELSVGPRVPGDPWIFRASLTVDGWGDLADLGWIDSRIPDGRFRGTAHVAVPQAIEVDVDGFEAELEASHVVADGQVAFGETISMRGLEVTARPLVLERLEPWLRRDLPFDGWLSGTATFSGTLDDVAATGRVTLVPTGYGGRVTTADFSGVLHRGNDLGATDWEARFAPLNYDVLRAIWPDAPFTGTGSGRIELDGRAARGMRVVADFTRESGTASDASRVIANGLVRRVDEAWTADLRGELAPLSVELFDRIAPELELRGNVRGPISASGRFDDLRVTGELDAERGSLVLDAALDASALGTWYRVRADAEGLGLSELSAAVPEPTTWSGGLELEGTGLSPDSLRASATLVARASRVGQVPVDSLHTAGRLDRGVLVTDTLVASIGGIDLNGKGRFGVVEGAWGSSRIDFRSSSIRRLRPLLMGVGDSVLVRDGLDELELDFLRATGVDPDTLPRERDIRLEGAVRGSVSVSGALDAFDMGLIVDVAGGAFRDNQFDSARVAVTATGLPGLDGTWGLGASAHGVVLEGRTFDQGGFEARMVQGAGDGRIEILRSPTESYRLAGDFIWEDPGGQVGLDEARLQVGEDVWNLSRPARIEWRRGELTVDSLRVDRVGDDPMTLEARGTLSREGASDFRLMVEGLHADRLVHIGQFRGLDVGGHIDLDLTVTGPSESPVIDGTLRIDGPRFRSMELSRLDGTLGYRDREATFSLQGWDGGRDAIDLAGEFPVDLSLGAVERRTVDAPMDIRISADSLDAAIALSYLSDLEQVVGVVSGEVVVRGTPSAPAPEGSVTLSNAEWTIEALGVRHRGVNGGITLNPDRTVDVELRSVGSGRSTVEGTVTLQPFLDPPLDLHFTFDRFQAVERLDVEAMISGQVDLGGSYTRPVATGSLTLAEGTINVDEFRRGAGVVDLSDPLLFDQGLGVDTTALVSQPLLAGLRNPFLDNLRVNVDLSVPRDTWLRSIETNVELTGDLLVAYDRRQNDLVLVGELEAVRGSHQVLNRTFDLDGGTVSFIGRPGLNPDLNINASTRIRRLDEDLEVMAHVGGTLIQPVVSLSTDEVGVGQADLVSYLLFGRPTTTRGTRQAQMLGGTGAEVAGRLAGQAIYSYTGTLASQFGAALAQGTGLVDYLSVLYPSDDFKPTQFEAGWYLGRDLFVVLVIGEPGSSTRDRTTDTANLVRGFRLEWDGSSGVHTELFLEDRFLRSSGAGFALPTLDYDKVVGLFVFREWGY